MKIIESLKVNGGYSGRKLTAFSLNVCIISLHVLFIFRPVFELFISLIIVDLVGVAFFLSIISVQQIIELKNGNVTKTTTNETTTTDTTDTTDI